MSKIKLKANESGTGILTIEAPNTDTDKTLTLPTSDGTLVTTDGTTFTGNVNFGDNDKAIFGASNDLQIYCDGSDSYITDAGTGYLYIRGTEFRLQNGAGNKTYIQTTDGGSCDIRYNGSTKLETTSTGIDVTGTITADGLTVADASAVIVLQDTSSGGPAPYHRLSTGLNSSAESVLNFSRSADGSSYSTSMTIDGDGNVGIGVTSPTNPMHIYTTSSAADVIRINNSTLDLRIGVNSGSSGSYVFESTANSLRFGTNNTERMRINSSGNVGIGASTLFGKLSVNSNGAPATSGNMSTGITIHNSTGGTALNLGTYDAGGYNYIQSGYVNSANTARNLVFFSGASESMRIDTSGNLLVNTTVSPTSSNEAGVKVRDVTMTSRVFTGGGTRTMTFSADGHYMCRATVTTVGNDTDNAVSVGMFVAGRRDVGGHTYKTADVVNTGTDFTVTSSDSGSTRTWTVTVTNTQGANNGHYFEVSYYGISGLSFS